MPPVITVENLGKCYTLRHQVKGEGLRHAIENIVTAPFRKLFSHALHQEHSPAIHRQTSEDFWALKGVSFEVNQGDVVGIIGRNGAGKSTLLKILSRITEPTEGRVTLRGRVASLLEVGTGFHPELTGRENIFLNGTILGMSRAEVRKKFDEIVAFAEVEKFIDTPVKRYSSGMYVRLAFAVAAHLEPEILVVDEVLAVGDAEFQRKCLGKMQDVSKNEGRTVLFVSHNMGAVQTLCCRGIVLAQGIGVFDGDSTSAVNQYLKLSARGKSATDKELPRSGTGGLRLTACCFKGEGGITEIVSTGGSAALCFEISPGTNPPQRFSIGFSIHNIQGGRLVVVYSHYSDRLFEAPVEPTTYVFRIEKLPLTPGDYTVGVRLVSGSVELDWPQEPVAGIRVEPGDYFRTGVISSYSSGDLLMEGVWE